VTGLVPSILAADLARLGEQVRDAEAAGADRFHIDVMDGHFVPNISLGPLVVRAIRNLTSVPLEAHLMIINPENFISTFARAGADVIIVHQEVCFHLHRVVQQIKAENKQAGVALNPATPIAMLDEILPCIDHVLIMTVNPGFGGQDLIPETVGKVRRMRHVLTERGFTCDLEVDGGIHEQTVPLVVDAGANLLVSGTGVFNNREGVADAIQRLRKASVG
jgi:ribulose-phosphate 3-epimerase